MDSRLAQLFMPARLGCLRCNLGAFARPELSCPGRSTFQPTKPSQGDGGRVLGLLYWCVLRRLPCGFKHDLVCALVGISRAWIAFL